MNLLDFSDDVLDRVASVACLSQADHACLARTCRRMRAIVKFRRITMAPGRSTWSNVAAVLRGGWCEVLDARRVHAHDLTRVASAFPARVARLREACVLQWSPMPRALFPALVAVRVAHWVLNPDVDDPRVVLEQAVVTGFLPCLRVASREVGHLIAFVDGSVDALVACFTQARSVGLRVRHLTVASVNFSSVVSDVRELDRVVASVAPLAEIEITCAESPLALAVARHYRADVVTSLTLQNAPGLLATLASRLTSTSTIKLTLSVDAGQDAADVEALERMLSRGRIADLRLTGGTYSGAVAALGAHLSRCLV